MALFDLDGTLIDRDAGFAAWLDHLAEQHGIPAPDRQEIERLDRRLRRREQFFDAVVARWPNLGDAGRIWAEYRRLMPTLAATYPGVLDGLRRLRVAGWRLGVVTNGEADNQEGKLAASGVGELIDGWCVSGATGVRKPDAAIFRAALTRIGGQAAAGAWLVGDDPVADVAGGAAVGLRTVWISHGAEWGSADPAPDFTVPTPAEAIDLLLVGGYS